MNLAKKHYDQHLAAVYSWMAGDPEVVLQRQRDVFAQLGITTLAGGLAVDLGSGSGAQSVALAELGFSVLAIDFCEPLLAELRQQAELLPIRTVNDDLLNFRQWIPEPSVANATQITAQLIVCMGDTLPHLDSLAKVAALFIDIERTLAPQGKIVLSFRDYVAFELEGEQRFIPVRNDGSTILTCFLEYQEATVDVHDLLYQKQEEQWVFTASSYPKLRLDPNWVGQQLQQLGLTLLQQDIINGMVCIVAQKL